MTAMSGDEAPYHVPEASGAYTNCQCSRCVELRLADPDRVVYTLSAREFAALWADGWREGYAAGKKR